MSGKICFKWRNYLTQGQAGFRGNMAKMRRSKRVELRQRRFAQGLKIGD